MRSWQLDSLEIEPHKPHILSSSREARVVVLHLPSGERMQDHEVHERAWIVVVAGELVVTTPDGESTSGRPGLLVELAPGERHEVVATTDAQFLLLLAPWPGVGHPVR